MEIGIITPPMGEYETEAELVHAMRVEAAEYGADAIFIESATEQTGVTFLLNGDVTSADQRPAYPSL